MPTASTYAGQDFEVWAHYTFEKKKNMFKIISLINEKVKRLKTILKIGKC